MLALELAIRESSTRGRFIAPVQCQAIFFYGPMYQLMTSGSTTAWVLVVSRRPAIVADAVLALQIQTEVTREMNRQREQQRREPAAVRSRMLSRVCPCNCKQLLPGQKDYNIREMIFMPKHVRLRYFQHTLPT